MTVIFFFPAVGRLLSAARCHAEVSRAGGDVTKAVGFWPRLKRQTVEQRVHYKGRRIPLYPRINWCTHLGVGHSRRLSCNCFASSKTGGNKKGLWLLDRTIKW